MLALACSKELLERGGTAEDQALLGALRQRSIRADLVAWEDPVLVSGTYRALLIRSCWDYHRRRAEFLETLRRVERAGVVVWNEPALVEWNSDKRYLRDLQAAGVDIVPTVFLEPGAEVHRELLSPTLGDSGWVIKPSVGATASGLVKVLPGEEERACEQLQVALGKGAWLVQPFLQAVAEEGEWSLVYLGGELSHAVLKKAAAGEFRVQKDFGGSVVSVPPPAEVVAAAEACLRALEVTPVYARVDLVRVSGKAPLMELELIEPELFLQETGALQRITELLAAQISKLEKDLVS